MLLRTADSLEATGGFATDAFPEVGKKLWEQSQQEVTGWPQERVPSHKQAGHGAPQVVKAMDDEMDISVPMQMRCKPRDPLKPVQDPVPSDFSQEGLVPYLLWQMQEGPETARIKAAKVLCSFAAYTPENCLTITRCELFSSVVSALQGSEALQEEAALLLSNLATNDESKTLILQQCLTTLAQLLTTGGTHVRIAVMAGLNNLARLDANSSQQVLESGVLPWLVEGLAAKSPQEQVLAALVLRSIASTDPAHAEATVNAGAVPLLLQLACGPVVEASLHSIWALAACAIRGPFEAQRILPHLRFLATELQGTEVGLAAGEAVNIILRHFV